MEEHSVAHTMLITMAAAISVGVMLIALGRRLNVSAIVLLLLGGVALGPEGLGIVQAGSLGDSLGVIVSLAVGLILFEGGLSLDPAGFRAAPGIIRRLLSVGVVTTWLASATAIYVIFDVIGGRGFGIPFCLLCGSLVIVTGPTVMAPLLKRIRVRTKVHNILHWEGVLIDPIGVFIALLCFEWIVDADGTGGTGAVLMFLGRLALGTTVGLIGGFAIARLLKTRLVPSDMQNIVALAFAVFIFGVAEYWLPEAGLLSVTVCGFVLGVKGPEKLKHLREFKAEITELMIGLLFILLASRLELQQFVDFGLEGALLVAVMIVVVRPLSIALSSWGQGLELREKAFLGWVAPRGIVAASLASLIGLRLAADNPAQSVFVETFVYSVIFATVLLSGFTAGGVAKLLGLRRPVPTGWLIVGAHRLARHFARFLRDSVNVEVILLDSNSRSVARARARGYEAIVADAMDAEDIAEREECLGVGNVLALTDNIELNALICDRWSDVVGAEHVFRWAPDAGSDGLKGTVVWSDMPAPSLLVTEIGRGAARVVPVERVERVDDPHSSPLAGVVGGQIVLAPAARIAAGEDVSPVLVVRRRGEYFQQALRRGFVVKVEPKSLNELLHQLVDLVVAQVPDAPRGEMLEELEEKERIHPSSPGAGVSIPHAHIAGLDDRVCAVAQIPGGLDVGAPDGAPVKLVFLLLSPPGDPQGHLEALAEIGRLVIAPARRERLVAADGLDEFLKIARETPGNATPERVRE